jgi:hypothetical protein
MGHVSEPFILETLFLKLLAALDFRAAVAT